MKRFFLSLLHCKSDAFFFFFFFAGSNGVLGDCLLANFEIYIYIYIYIYTQVHQKKNIMKNFNIFVTHFRKWNPYIIQIFQAFISWNFDDYGWQILKTQNSVSQKLEYYIRSIKKGYFKQKCQASEKYVHFYALNTWLGLLLHELLHQCGVAWRQSAGSTAQV